MFDLEAGPHSCMPTWDDFVGCLQNYVSRCFSSDERSQFNKAVQQPVQSIHRMCSDPAYQEEYLTHAPCIKQAVTDARHCGGAYRQLAEMVVTGDDYLTGGDPSGNNGGRAGLCCAYESFSRCVVSVSRMRCDLDDRARTGEHSASKLARQVLDKALGFLGEQCHNYIPNSGDCAMANVLRTTSMEDSDGSQTIAIPASYNSPQSRTTAWETERAPSAAPSWGPPVQASIPPSWMNNNPNNPNPNEPENNEGGLYSHRSSRPLNYGRGMTWTPSTNVESANPKSVDNFNGNSVVMQTSSEIPYWATANSRSWSNNEQSSTETWYPMVGGVAPEKQGLRGGNSYAPTYEGGNFAALFKASCISIILSSFVILLL
ncbi:uncharacterized protein LOC113386193 [Ctenocephalides felis]|uniref:uncharacterized protein LOC113386193 n=1 Tax=Ctenocephalides felis TaxID=7515 RepID=UPI000E6E59C3|nr:uncharacterized protein LOC113386193 [Ctenocephalides felis]